MSNPFLNDLQKQWIKRHQRKSVSEQDHLLEAVREFMFLVVDGEKKALSIPVAFELAREHFRRHGKAMMEVADLVSLEMVESAAAQNKAKS